MRRLSDPFLGVKAFRTDLANRDDIRIHLRHIAHAFQTGDFDIPMFVHDTVAPGVPEMKRLQEDIRYVFEETPNGGRVVISSTDKDAPMRFAVSCVFRLKSTKQVNPCKFAILCDSQLVGSYRNSNLHKIDAKRF